MPCKEEEDKVNVSKLNNVKQVQHDSMHNVILNLVQDLSAEKDKKRLAARC